MKQIGVFICNYNGKEWVISCIESLLKQSIQNFDICVVDNASTDKTAEAVKEKYGERVTVLCNPENLGGAGGFDKGLAAGLKKGYPYLVLLDNDIVLEQKTVENMRDFLESHKDVGIVGAKVMIMDKPDTIQDFGNYLDFHIFKEVNGHKWELDSPSLPLVNECDYVPTCAVMIRAEILKKTGTMPVDNFIYYDDIELSYKIGLQGYKVAALGNAKVWHKGGFRKANVNTFPRYYFLRNRLHFFAKYTPEEKLGVFTDTILSEVIAQLYGYYNKGQLELFRTTIYALDDFIHEVRGKADSFKILQLSEKSTPFEQVLKGRKCIRIFLTDDLFGKDSLDIYHLLLYIVTNIQTRNPQEKIWISLTHCSLTEREFKEQWRKVTERNSSEVPLPPIHVSEEDRDKFDLEFRLCEHVKSVRESVLPEIYIDRYCNCITSKEDYEYFQSYPINEKLFFEMYRPLVSQAVKQIRTNMKKGSQT